MKFIFRLKPAGFFLLFLLLIIQNQKLYSQDINNNLSVPKLALKTNILYDGAMTPNIGLEIVFKNQWSINANWYFAHWENDRKHRYWDINAGMVEVRKWIGHRARMYQMQGHHLGLFFGVGNYDFERGHKGYQSKFSFVTGLNYGYSINLYRSLYLDFCLGVGYLGGRYKKYKPQEDKYCLIKSKMMHWVGPVNAEITIVWVFSDLFFKNRKGGTR